MGSLLHLDEGMCEVGLLPLLLSGPCVAVADALLDGALVAQPLLMPLYTDLVVGNPDLK